MKAVAVVVMQNKDAIKKVVNKENLDKAVKVAVNIIKNSKIKYKLVG